MGEAESGARQGDPGGGQYQPYQVGLGVEVQFAVELLDVSAHRRLCPVRGHGNVPDAVTGGQGSGHVALGPGQAECHGEAGRINLGALGRIDQQDERGDALGSEVGPVGDRADMQGEREGGWSPPDRHGPAGDGLPPVGQGVRYEPLELGGIGQESGAEDAAPVYHAVAAAQNAQAEGIGLDDSPTAVEGEYADEGVIEQLCQRGAERLGGGKCLSDLDELTNMGEQLGDERDLFGVPAVGVERVGKSPGDVYSVRAVHAQVQTIRATGPPQ